MAPEQAWQDLAAAALLGTERRPFAPPSAAGPLGAILGALAGREPEKALLGTASALALYRRAGRLPTADPSAPVDPAPDDPRPRCSAGSDGHLALMLDGTHADVLPEWLGALAASGRRPAEEAVPDLLEAGRASRDLRPAVAHAVGPLGAWLARQNPEWSYAAGAGADAPEDDAAIEATWQTGTLLQRAELLKRVRGLDPAKGRGLVASTWAVDDHEARAGFVEAFATGLGPDDEAFLESALDDRRKEVRTAAAEALARLPESAYVRRMVARAEPLVRPGPSADGLDVTLPEACDKAMIRDGIEPKSRRYGMGEKAWWLSRIVARVPPSAWALAWGLAPAAIAEAAARHPWNEALYPSLVESAVLHRDLEWIDALLPHRRLAGTAFNPFSLLDALPADRREAACLVMIRDEDAQGRPGPGGGPLTEEQVVLLDRVPAPWGDEVSRLFLDRLPLNLADTGHYYYHFDRLFRTAARSLPTATVLAGPPRRPSGQPADHQYVHREIDRQLEAFLATIQFRHDMIRELRA